MKKTILRLILAAAVFAVALIVKNAVASLILFIASTLIAGAEVFYNAVRNIFKGNFFDENFLMTIAAIGAFCIGEYPEAAAVMLFYRTGEAFQDYAVSKSRKSVAEIMKIRPDYANLLENGNIIKTDPEKVAVGSKISVMPGERIPLDGKILEGDSALDTSALTGESVPRSVTPGDEVLSGSVNLSGALVVETTKEAGESTVSKILELVENAASKKSASERFITKFARYYTPAVVVAAVLIAIVPCLFEGFGAFQKWLYRGLTFLVISCPCALVISVPLSFFGGIGGASKSGILIKGGSAIEALAKAETVLFDKTGTLTKGVFKVNKIVPYGISREALLDLTAHAEFYSKHPAATAVKERYSRGVEAAAGVIQGRLDIARLKDAKEFAGMGACAVVDGQTVYAGNAKLMKIAGAEIPEAFIKEAGETGGVAIHTALDGKYIGMITAADEIKEDAKKAVSDLKARRVKRIVMLTGDSVKEAGTTAKILGIDEYHASLLPQDKVEIAEKIMEEKTSEAKKGSLIFAGDGINDAPLIARADVGFAMGGLGSDAAVEAADAVIMTDEPSKIALAIAISQKTLSIARQNIIFAVSAKLLVMALGAVGLAPLWLAIFADVGVAMIAVLNALRALNVNKLKA